MPRFAVILPAAGKSTRFGDERYKKPFASLAGRPVWIHAVEKFVTRPDVCQVVLVISDEDRDDFDARFGADIAFLEITLVTGGADRAASVAKGLAAVKPEAEFIAIHDAARPLVSELWIDRVFEAAIESGAAMLACPVVGTLKRVSQDRQVVETVSREGLWEAQTPQVFRRDWYEAALAAGAGQDLTDDAAFMEQFGKPVQVLEAPRLNFKITTQDDLKMAEQVLASLPQKAKRPSRPFEDDDMWR